MTDVKTLFYSIQRIIKTNENYVPRPYQTIGGRWTVDTWQVGDVKYQIMDEGYTSVLSGMGVRVIDDCSGITLKEGDEESLKKILEYLQSIEFCE